MMAQESLIELLHLMGLEHSLDTCSFKIGDGKSSLATLQCWSRGFPITTKLRCRPNWFPVLGNLADKLLNAKFNCSNDVRLSAAPERLLFSRRDLKWFNLASSSGMLPSKSFTDNSKTIKEDKMPRRGGRMILSCPQDDFLRESAFPELEASPAVVEWHLAINLMKDSRNWDWQGSQSPQDLTHSIDLLQQSELQLSISTGSSLDRKLWLRLTANPQKLAHKLKNPAVSWLLESNRK